MLLITQLSSAYYMIRITSFHSPSTFFPVRKIQSFKKHGHEHSTLLSFKHLKQHYHHLFSSFVDLSSNTTFNNNKLSKEYGGSTHKENHLRPYFSIYYNDVYEVPLPPNHRFPMKKYRQVREMLQSKISSLSAEERNLVDCEFNVSPLVSIPDLSTTHCPEYIQRYLQGKCTELELRNVGFPWSEQGVSRSLSSVGGTVAAASFICEQMQNTIIKKQQNEQELYNNQNKVIVTDDTIRKRINRSIIKENPIWSAHVAGGTHHAFRERGEGFCVFSDIAVACNVILQKYPNIVKNILILDLDVHQGNGNAVLFNGRSDVYTFSMHCMSNYFSPRENSDLDIELPEGCTDETYLVTLRHWLNRLAKEGGDTFDFIFFQAGVDILQEDRLGRMSITSEGVRLRNNLVFEFAKKLSIPLCITMGGGYPKNDWGPIIEAHSNVYFQAHQFLSRYSN